MKKRRAKVALWKQQVSIQMKGEAVPAKKVGSAFGKQEEPASTKKQLVKLDYDHDEAANVAAAAEDEEDNEDLDEGRDASERYHDGDGPEGPDDSKKKRAAVVVDFEQIDEPDAMDVDKAPEPPVDDDDVDPLDAFMAGVSSEFTKLTKQSIAKAKAEVRIRK
jgi:hypothetical protein